MRKNKNRDGIIISISKTKLGLALLGSILFIALGVWIMWTADAQSDDPPEVMKTLAVICIIFFGACAIYASIRILDDRPGLIIDSDGITDNSSAAGAGLIPWETIIFVQRLEMRQSFIAVGVADPKELIKKQSLLKKIFMSLNHKFFKTPIHLSSNALKTDFDTLEKLITENWEKYKNDRD